MAWSDIVTAPPPQAPGPRPTPEQLANLPSAAGYASPQLPPAWNPLPILKQVLETPVPGMPPLWQSQGDTSQRTWNPAPVIGQILKTEVPGATPAKKEITPESLGQKQVSETEQKPETKTITPESLGQKQVPEAEQKTETKAVTPESLGQKQVPEAEPPPQPQPQQPETRTGADAPQGTSAPIVLDPDQDPQEQINALIDSGKSPGEAQAIVMGQQPKTLKGNEPEPKPAPAPKTEQQPQQQAPKAIDTLKAGKGDTVDPVSLYSYLLGKFARSSVLNHPPADGDVWKIKTGSAAEWAAFALAVAKQESDLNARSTNLRDPGGSYGLFQFSQKGQPQYTNGEDQYDPQHSADAFVRAVEQLVGQKGKIANLGVTFGSILRPNEAGQYIDGAQKVAAGGSGKDLVSSGGDGGGGGPPAPGGQPAGQPMVSIPSAGGTPQLSGQGPRGGGWSGDSGYGGGGETTPRTADAGPINLTSLLGAAAGGAAAGSLFGGGGGRPQAQQPKPPPAEEEDPMIAALMKRGFTQQQAINFAQSSQTIAPGKGVPPLKAPPSAPSAPAQLPAPSGVTLKFPSAKQLMPGKVPKIVPTKAPPAPGGKQQVQARLPAPPPAPSAPAARAPVAAPQVDPSVVQGLMKRGFTREQAEDFARKSTVAPVHGGPPSSGAAPPPSPPPPPSGPAPREPEPQPQPAKEPAPTEPTEFAGRPAGSTHGDPNPKGMDALSGHLKDQGKQHKALLSPDDPRVSKQDDGYIKGEHFVEGDPFHENLLSGLPDGKQGRQRQLLSGAEQAIADKSPLHISYLSSPKEAEKFPTRDSRKFQYDKHSPEARLMGTTEGQLVGHSFIPLNVGVKLGKGSEPHQGYVQGISTNVLANNFEHVNAKLAEMGRKSPYEKLGTKFANDLEGYYSNLNAGHVGSGTGFTLGTEHHPNEPDRGHVPYRLSRKETDFIGTVINNTAAFAKHEDAEKIRELARVNGTLIDEKGETNALRNDIEKHEPGWRNRVLEPSIKTFKTGLIHQIHPTEQHLPETIRPGREYQALTKALARTSAQGRPDIAIAASLHSTLEDNRKINDIERDFSEQKIDEAGAHKRLKELGEDPSEYKFVKGSGGLVSPYEDDAEAISREEHDKMKSHLREQWVSGKMDIEDYRKRIAEIPLPTKVSPKKGTDEPKSPSVPAIPRQAVPDRSTANPTMPDPSEPYRDSSKSAPSSEPLVTPATQVKDLWKRLQNGDFDHAIDKYGEASDKLVKGSGALTKHMRKAGILKKGDPDHESDAEAMAHWLSHHDAVPHQKSGEKYSINSHHLLRVLHGLKEPEEQSEEEAA